MEGGAHDASVWLRRFNAAYARKLVMPIFPGSLNLRVPRPFDWSHARYAEYLMRFDRAEYGGERDILLLPCRLASLNGHAAWLWTTTTPREGDARCVVEIITDVSLRATYGLEDGDTVRVDILQRDPGSCAPRPV